MPGPITRPEFFPGLPVTEGMLVPVDRTLPPVPLKHTAIRASIIGTVCSVEVTQQFHNTHSRPVEAVYVFPLPEDAAVTDLKLTLGNRVIQGDIREREQARQDYAQARNAGQGAALLEQERPNIFTVSVANIQPDEQVQVALRFHNRVDYDDGEFEFVLPTVVLPRYAPPPRAEGEEVQPGAGERPPDADRLTTPLLPEGIRDGHTLSIRVELDAGKLDSMSSPSHPIDTEQKYGTTIVTLREASAIPNKDFILRYTVANNQLTATPFTYRTAGQPGTLLLMLVPQIAPQPDEIMPRELLFVLDRSGSMGGDSIVQARNALQGCLRALNPGDTFNIFPFDDRVEQFAPQPLPFTQEHIDQADAYIGRIQARGGTEILRALQTALEQPRDSERLRVLVFLTDGAVSNEDQVLRELHKALNEARVYAFGIGSAVNRFLLDKLAEVGRGSVEYIFPGEDIEAAVQRFQNRAAFPVLTDVQLDWGGGRVTDVYPNPLPDLYAGQPLTILARFHNATRTTLRLIGRSPRGRYEQTVELELPEATPDRSDHWKALTQLWVRARIDALMSRERDDPKQKSAVRDEILGLALEHRLLSPYTAFVAIEERRDEHGGREAAERIVVPIHLPQGTRREAFEPQDRHFARGFTAASAAGMIQPPAYDALAAPPPMAGGPPPAPMSRAPEEKARGGRLGERIGAMRAVLFRGTPKPRAMPPQASSPQPESFSLYDTDAVAEPDPGTMSTEERVTRALRYLARTQNVNGSWGDSAIATALALLAFLKQGHSDRAGSYRAQLTRTFRWLTQHINSSQVAPVVAWALSELARSTDNIAHKNASQGARNNAAVVDELDAAVLALAQQQTAGQVLPASRDIATLLSDERGILELVVRERLQVSTFPPGALSRYQSTGGAADGAVVPPGSSASKPDGILFAATAAGALLGI